MGTGDALRIERFIFNEFSENTYLLYAPEGEAMVIDLGCRTDEEWARIATFVEKERCTVKYLLNTHGHLDHLFGVPRGREAWKEASFWMHEADLQLLESAPRQAALWGMEMSPMRLPDSFLKHGDVFELHGERIEVIHTPGHSQGGVCFYLYKAGILFSGDTLFQHSIGRTDLPGGNYEQLIESIRSRLLVLHDEVRVLPGHGEFTTIGEEREHNPFL